MCFNTWSLVGALFGEVVETLRVGTQLEEVSHWKWRICPHQLFLELSLLLDPLGFYKQNPKFPVPCLSCRTELYPLKQRAKVNPSSLKLLLSDSLSLPPNDFTVFLKRKTKHNVFNVEYLKN